MSDYDTSLAEAQELLFQTTMNVRGVLAEPIPIVDLVNFGDSSIDFKIRYWTLPEQKAVNKIKTETMLAIKRACDSANINIPYPIRTIYYSDREESQN